MFKYLPKKTKLVKAISLGLILQSSIINFAYADITPQGKKVKNVIVMIPDGMSVGATTLARLYQEQYANDANVNLGYDRKTLKLPELMVGMVSTHDAAGKITDSAAAGTALATGFKTKGGYVGITADLKNDYLESIPNPAEKSLDSYMPVATILEAARLQGKATGIVSTSEFMHATPAAFTSHDISRNSYDNLSEQIIYNNLDVILGGGRLFINTDLRKDKESLKAIAESEGFSIVEDTVSLENFTGDKLLGLFGANENAQFMSNHIDRDPAVEPSIAQMTEKAINQLNQDEDGFFLMVEGSKVDWAAHGNDPVALVSEIRGFDEAVNLAYNFAKDDGETLLIVVTDHGNAGLSIADRSISQGYDKTPWTTFIEPIKASKITVEEAVNQFNLSPTEAGLKDILQNQMGLKDITDEQVASVYQSLTSETPDTKLISKLISTKAKIGFGHDSHTAEEVVLYAYDPRGNHIQGLIDNIDIPQFVANSIDVDLVETTNQLFINVKESFAGVNFELLNLDNASLKFTFNNKTIEIPQNKNYILIDNEPVKHQGVNVMIKDNWYISQTAIDEINN